MKFKQLLEVLHDYTDINVETDESITAFETSVPGLTHGTHGKYYDDHQDWDVVYAYPDFNMADGNFMVIKIREPKPPHDCFFESVEGDDIHAYCMECGQSIRKW